MLDVACYFTPPDHKIERNARRNSFDDPFQPTVDALLLCKTIELFGNLLSTLCADMKCLPKLACVPGFRSETTQRHMCIDTT